MNILNIIIIILFIILIFLTIYILINNHKIKLFGGDTRYNILKNYPITVHNSTPKITNEYFINSIDNKYIIDLTKNIKLFNKNNNIIYNNIINNYNLRQEDVIICIVNYYIIKKFNIEIENINNKIIEDLSLYDYIIVRNYLEYFEKEVFLENDDKISIIDNINDTLEYLNKILGKKSYNLYKSINTCLKHLNNDKITNKINIKFNTLIDNIKEKYNSNITNKIIIKELYNMNIKNIEKLNDIFIDKKPCFHNILFMKNNLKNKQINTKIICIEFIENMYNKNYIDKLNRYFSNYKFNKNIIFIYL